VSLTTDPRLIGRLAPSYGPIGLFAVKLALALAAPAQR
jgi:hypothetical protein